MDIRKDFFAERGIKHWGQAEQGGSGESLSPEVFEERQGVALSAVVVFGRS